MKVIHYIGINSAIRSAGILSAFLFSAIFGLTFLPLSLHTDTTEAATGTAQESSLTLAVERDTAALDLNVASSNGTFATSSESNKAAFSITTNNYTGYTLSISASDDAGTLANGNDSLTSITTNKTLTDTTFDNSDYNGMWGYKPSKYMNGNTVVDNTGTNAVYLISPTTTATTLHVTSAANSTANSYDIALGARADYTKPSGTYSKTFILTAVANKINYSVTYDKNTTDTVANMPYSNTGNVQSGDTNSTSITLSDLVPVRDGYNFKGWCSVATSDDTCSGTIYNPDGAGTDLTYGIDQTTINVGTLYAMWESAETKCDGTKLCVQYEGNGLTYGGSKTVNRVNYNSSTTLTPMTKYSHTSNISDAGVQSGNFTTPSDTNEVITIPGAESLNISFTYQTSANSVSPSDFYGAAVSSFWEGNHPNYSVSSNYSSGVKCGGNTTGYYGGGSSPTTIGCTVSGDSVTFGFYSAKGFFGSPTGYGYYAVITGTSVINTRTIASGEYATPTGTDAIFHGWSSTQTTAGGGHPSDVEYTNESDVMSNIPGNEGESKTLYAVWQQGYSITFNKDSNVSSIAVLDSDGNTIGTITSSGQSLTLAGGDTYTIKPTHTTGYAINITKTSGAGTLSGSYADKKFTVGAGAATISVTSKVMQPIQNWTSCSSLAVGDTEQVYDTRDNEVYLVGKLADNKCWMLDNLRLDLGNTTVLNNTTASNTNASATSLNYMKNGGGTTSDKYPTTKINNVAWTSSSQNYYSIPMTVSSGNGWDKDTTVTSYGLGSGKIGVYYNYCAASAGSYCYGDGTSAGTSSGNAEEDICPAGWRMPTSGSSGEYRALYTAYSSDATNFRNALSTPLSGFFDSGSAGLKGSGGSFWSSTRYNDGNMYHLSVGASSVGPQNGNYRYIGYSVRCLLQ